MIIMPRSSLVILRPGTILKAIAYPQRGGPSEVVTMRYRAVRPSEPEITPMPNQTTPITDVTKVTIEAGKETDKIYYTINGTDPTESDKLYSDKITVMPPE